MIALLLLQHLEIQVLKELGIALLEQLLGKLLRIFELLWGLVQVWGTPIVDGGVADSLLVFEKL